MSDSQSDSSPNRVSYQLDPSDEPSPAVKVLSTRSSSRSSTSSDGAFTAALSTSSVRSGLTAALSLQIREQQEKFAPEYTMVECMLIMFSKWTTSAYTETTMFILICIDVVMLLCSVQLDKFNHTSLWWCSVCHGIFLVIFLSEALIRSAGECAPRSRQRLSSLFLIAAPKSHSHDVPAAALSKQMLLSRFVLWDSFLVMSAAIGAWLWGWNSLPTIAPSMLRISRVTRLVGPYNRFLMPMQIFFSTMVDSLQFLLSGFFVFLLNSIFFSVLAMGIVQSDIDDKIREDAIHRFGAKTVENCLFAFSSLPMSMMTMFTLSIGDQWHEVAVPLTFVCPLALPLFILYTLVSSGAILGLLFGTLFLSLQRVSANHAELHAEVSDLTIRERVLGELTELFEEIDADSSGYITCTEFQFHWRTNPDFNLIMEKLLLKDSEVHIIWDVMDTNRDGNVTKDEFIKFMLRILFDGEKWSRLKTMHCASQAHFRSEELTSDVKNLQDELHANRILLEKFVGRVTMGKKLTESVASGVSRVTAEESITTELFEKVESGELTRSVSADQTYNATQSLENYNASEDHDSNLLHATAIELMRCVDAEQISHYGSQDVLAFWGGGAFIDKYSDKEFDMSIPCEQCDYFVSHCWTPPKQWYKHFQRNNKFETFHYIKAMELHNVLSESKRQEDGFRFSQRSSFGQTTVWVDKCCIPQQDKQIKEACVALLEDFMKLSKGLIVILSWHYFTRLWCVYEWACFLRTSDPAYVELGFDAFLKLSPDETLPLYIDSIENLSVRSAQCSVESDHEILEAKVFQYYQGDTPDESFASFERFAKCTAICLMAKQLVMWRARTSAAEEAAWLEPFRELAERLDYRKLADVLRRAQPAAWFERCGKNREAFNNIFRYWFENDCLRYLTTERMRAVRKCPNRCRDSVVVKNYCSSYSERRSRDVANSRLSTQALAVEAIHTTSLAVSGAADGESDEKDQPATGQSAPTLVCRASI